MTGTASEVRSRASSSGLRRVVVTLLAGVVVTIGVTWGLALIYPVDASVTPTAYGYRELTPEAVGKIPATGIHVLTWRRHGAQVYCTSVDDRPAGGFLGPLPTSVVPEQAVSSWAVPHVIPGKGGEADERPGPFFHSHYIAAYGWPLPALWCRINARNQGKDGSLEMVAAGGVMLSADTPFIKPPQQLPPTLPLRPHWPALAINLAVTTAACWLIKLAFISLRARLYIPPGHCRHCRYDLRGLTTPICPECGSPAPVAAPANAASTSGA